MIGPEFRVHFKTVSGQHGSVVFLTGAAMSRWMDAVQVNRHWTIVRVENLRGELHDKEKLQEESDSGV